jgi:predicted transcriptional regulator
MSVLDQVVERLFGPAIERQVQARLASVTVRIDDRPGWEQANKPGPQDRSWSERLDDLDDAFEAWVKNFLVRRVVTLCRSYVIGDGITLTSSQPDVDTFVKRFWTHPQNRMSRRLAPMLNELVRAGEIFPTLHTNRADGTSYIRFIPASQIREIKTAKNDYEVELEYGQRQTHTAELKWWVGPGHRQAYRKVRGGSGGKLQPLMLHFCVNREIGCTRGEGDLGPLLPWAKRYTAWLEDRVRLNRVRTRQGILDVQIADDAVVEEKRQQLTRQNPLESGIYVHGPGETVLMHSLSIGADEASADGEALRLANATAANVGLHYLGEGGAVNYATAKEMGEPTARFYTERQSDFCDILQDLTAAAYHRYCSMGFADWPEDDELELSVSVSEVARADNESLARSANLVVRALTDMARAGWIDDKTAAGLAFKFAGEPLGEEEIAAILTQAETEQPEPLPEPAPVAAPSGNGGTS